MPRPFNSELVLEEKISEATLRAYHVGFDENKFRLKPLVDLLVRVIPEFAFGYQEGATLLLTDVVDKLREAARLIYTTDNYNRRGEFGEIVLHLLLRDFCETIPLTSKIYFKDARNNTVKGFDGVHIQICDDIKKIWLGESKIYKGGTSGVRGLAEDVKNHLTQDYLRSEFNLISRKIPMNIPDREFWINLMHEHQTLENILSSICVPCVCTYSSTLFKNHKDATSKYLNDFKEECYNLKEKFDNANIVTNAEIILMLLPVPSKKELVEKLDERLKHAQQI
jgi:hypothetical protein